MNYGFVSQTMQQMSLQAVLDVEIPMFFAMAKQDRIVDNAKVLQHTEAVLKRSRHSRVALFDTEHAIHFAEPDKLAKEIYSFIVMTREIERR